LTRKECEVTLFPTKIKGIEKKKIDSLSLPSPKEQGGNGSAVKQQGKITI
jgi:hypothetical protein